MAKKKTSAQISADAAKTTWDQNNLWAFATAAHAADQNFTPPGVTIPTFTPTADPAYANLDTNTGTQLNDTYTNLGVTPVLDDKGVVTGYTYGGGQYFQGAQSLGIDELGHEIGQGDTRYSPSSKLEMMKRAFEDRKRATQNSYGNQVFAGAYKNATQRNSDNYTLGYDSLQRGAKGYYGDLVSRAIAAKDGRDVSLSGEGINALDRFNAAHANDPAPTLKANISGPVKKAVAKVTGKKKKPKYYSSGSGYPGALTGQDRVYGPTGN